MSEPPEDDIDTGEPIGELRSLSEPADQTLIRRVSARVNRRMLGAEIVRYSWFVPFMVVFEYLKVVIDMLAPDPKEEERDR